MKAYQACCCLLSLSLFILAQYKLTKYQIVINFNIIGQVCRIYKCVTYLLILPNASEFDSKWECKHFLLFNLPLCWHGFGTCFIIGPVWMMWSWNKKSLSAKMQNYSIEYWMLWIFALCPTDRMVLRVKNRSWLIRLQSCNWKVILQSSQKDLNIAQCQVL